MTVGVPESRFRTFRRLWQRAPAWRLLGLVAALLTLLCVVFPPHPNAKQLAPAADPQAAYTAAAPAPPAATPAPATPPPVAAHTVVPPAPTAPARVQTADLSLATPGESHAPDGLNDALAGHRFSGSLRVDGFDVPLPPGDWVQLAGMHFDQKTTAGELLMLGRVKNRRLMGYVRITAGRSIGEPESGFRASPGCDRQNENTNVLVREALEPFGHQSCWLMDHAFLAPLQAWADRANKLPPLERAAAGDLAAKGVTYPQEMMGVRFTRAERWGLLEVRYVFNPEEDHIPSTNVATYADSDWQPANIQRYPEKVAYVTRLSRWGENFWTRFKTAFDAGQSPASR